MPVNWATEQPCQHSTELTQAITQRWWTPVRRPVLSYCEKQQRSIEELFAHSRPGVRRTDRLYCNAQHSTAQHSTIQWTVVVCIGYCSAAVDKRVRSTRLYHCRQCSILLKLRSDRIDYTVRRLLYDARLQPKVAKTVPVRAECGLS